MGNLLIDIPFLLEAAAVLAAFVHPNHIVYLCSWGFTHLPPTCNFKLFGYRTKTAQKEQPRQTDLGRVD